MSNGTESSLPQEAAHRFHSSPPLHTQYSLPPMEDGASKSDPAAPQDPLEMPNRSKPKRMNTDEMERRASTPPERDSLDEHAEADQEASDDEQETDPATEISEFDWDDLHQRYHDAIKECSREEDELMQEWTNLMEYFRIWASSGHEHETDRTFRRLQTRTMYVQNEEDELEQKRKHYLSVVNAFESALNLLKQSTMFRD